MTYPFVAAKYFTSGGMTEPRAIVIHMAQGGGTVSWLTHPTNDNSSHFVIEYTGRIVQMVRDADASHSLHVSFDADTNDAPDFGTYSAEIGKSVLGDGWADPNRYIFAVEIEGYADVGPTVAQAGALKLLIDDLRARHPSIRGLLGHRDFQDYKACPGGMIPWAALGGHGLFAQEVDDMDVRRWKAEPWTPAGARRPVRSTPDRTAAGIIVGYIEFGQQVVSTAEISAGGNDWRGIRFNGTPGYILRSDFTPIVQGGATPFDATYQGLLNGTLPVVCPPAIDCAALVKAAVATEYARVTAFTTAEATITFPPVPS